ncbi:MAG: ATP-binding protein [Treponema sp.]|nr:ATP-binding protein [Treponema sp.]
MNWALSKKPAFYINLRDFPIYGREGFIPDATPLPGAEKAPPWKQISPAGDSELVVVKEKFNVPRLAFLSPFGQSPREYTYRIVFNLPSERYDEFWGDKTITPAIHIPAIGDNWEVYLNGTLVRSEVHLDGSGEITSHRAQRKVRFPFDNELFHSGDNVIDFRIIGDPAHENLGFFYGIPLFISEFSYVDRSSGEYLPIAIIGIYFFIGLYHFLLFMMRPGDRYNLFYSLFSIVLGIYFFSRTSVIYRISPDTNLWVRIELASVFMIFPLLSAFFDELTHQRLKLPTKIYGALSIALSLAECIFSPQFGEDALILWLPTIAGWIVYIFAYYFGYTFFYSVRQEWKKRRAAGENRSLLREYLHQIGSSPLGNIMIGLLLVFFTGGFDIIDSIFLNIGFLTSLYGFMVFNLGIAFILARRFGELYNQLNLANITLEGTVKERTKALEEQTLIAVSASNAKSDFLANMSHEIRTPLNAILGFSELTLLEPRDSKIHTNLQNIHNSATHLLGLINDILDISKIESGKLELHPGEYDLVSLLNDAIALNTVRIGDRPVAFHLELDETLPSRLYGDVLRLRQILNNLLSNAIKFTREGEVRFSVFRGAGDAPPGEICLCFEVRDTGVGIKEEDRGKIFSRFNQASSKDGSIIEGTGLGLDISRQLAELMNGGISLESEYGKGSVFTVTVRQGIIRQAKPVGREIAAVLENLTFLNRHLLQMNFKRVQMPGVRVLVVDDVPSNLEVAGAFLSLYGMKVDTAGGGEEAINILREKPELYDLVFLDHMMPGVNGPAVLKALREDIGGLYAGSLPVIALSANALVGSGEMFMKMGFQDFISKPINAFALDQVLKKWLPEHKIEGPAEPEAEANDPPSSAAVSPSASGNAAQENPGVSIFSIEGINTSMGYRNSGCDDESYHYMLDSFCRDSEEKVSALRHLMYYIQSVEDYDNINENTAALLETMLRIMKNSALSIGAEDAAAEAAVLEEKAKTGDIKGLLSALPAFYLNIQSAADRIREKLIS